MHIWSLGSLKHIRSLGSLIADAHKVYGVPDAERVPGSLMRISSVGTLERI